MKAITQNKARGFRMTLVCVALSIVTMVVYALLYARTRFMSWESVYIMAGGVVLTLVLIFARLYNFAPSALMAADFLASLFFIYHIYFYVSSVMTGIQFSGFSMEFFVCVALFVVTIALSVVCVFMRQTQEQE